jgi:hypothetical protein
MSFINHFISPFKKGQSVLEFLVLATAVLAAVAWGGPMILRTVSNSGEDIMNMSAGQMQVTLKGNQTGFIP